VQLYAGIGAEPDDVAGIGRYLRLVKNEAEHFRSSARFL
jgi:hypothetical protein